MTRRDAITEVFGTKLFNTETMRERLPRHIFEDLQRTIEEDAEKEPSVPVTERPRRQKEQQRQKENARDEFSDRPEKERSRHHSSPPLVPT